MKAAVIYSKEDLPHYVDLPEPTTQHDDEILATVKAVAIKHFDKVRATGSHYSSDAPKETGRVIGSDGICLLPDGTRVYTLGVSGMMAEKAVIEKSRIVAVPPELDYATAAALPNAVIGSAMGLRFKADIRPGDVVLINGATGFTGQVAVQLAKHYKAGKVIATGRDPQSLDALLSLGADETIPVTSADFKTRIKDLHAGTPIDIVIDYLWGATAEMILSSLQGNGSFTNRIRYVSVGAVTGDLIRLSAANLRSVDLQLTGSGLGAWSRSQVSALFSNILPEMFALAARGHLKVNTITLPLADIDKLWNMQLPNGQRLVVTI